MISMKKMTKAQAKEFVDSVDNLSDTAFADLTAQWHSHSITIENPDYEELRKKVLDAYEEAAATNDGYQIDLDVGLCLFEMLSPEKGFTLVMANDDDIWRYLSCKIFPDITYERYPKPAKNDIRLNKKRFYLHTRRIWLKTLWWYVFLSWQGDTKKTRSVLKDFGTDTISDFIERTGQGYRVLLYRQLMKSYANVENKSSDLFNVIQKQNLVNCRTVEPGLVEGAEQGYVDSLFKQLSVGEDHVD